MKFVRPVHGRIDVSPQSLLCVRQRTHNIGEGRVAADEQFEVARCAELTASAGAEHERDQHLIAERRQGLSENVGETGGLGEQPLELRDYRRLAVGLEIHLPTLNGSVEQPGGGQLLELSVD